ncbi:hypothetical protein NQ317_012952 [Molorchus minor]|uniref:Uncharacterized protein n=1 Tax=Molorchus minor TaxID=1323400 RepID=A0ABQ9JMU8_9CUCU|nr:hypothetical protein NQ317_012952 [Molorchus minor]
MFCVSRKEIEVPFLREIVRIRDKPESSHTAAASRDQGTMSLLLQDVHSKQHCQEAHSEEHKAELSLKAFQQNQQNQQQQQQQQQQQVLNHNP